MKIKIVVVVKHFLNVFSKSYTPFELLKLASRLLHAVRVFPSWLHIGPVTWLGLSGWSLWQTLPTYVTSTRLPYSSRITNFIFALHSGRLHSAPPLKNTEEWILREFADLTWLFLKRTLHHGLLSFILLANMRVQCPLNKRPPLGNDLTGILAQSSLVSLNLAVVPSISTRKKLCSSSSSSSLDKSESA